MRFLACLFVLCAAVSLPAQSVLRLHGSTTVRGALEARAAELERRGGVKVEWQALGSSSGLLALAGGHADIAMLSEPLDELAQRLNAKKPGTIVAAECQATAIGVARLVFIVNPRNAVRQLSAAQLAGVLSGKIQNWRELGGADLPIMVVSLANAGTLVENKVLGGEKISAAAKQVPNTSQIPPLVAQEPGAIGIVASTHPRGKTSVVATEADVATPLFLVTKGAPSPVERAFIDAARALLEERTSAGAQ
jgi:phosphate transport system substrate-binding protein